MLRLRHVGRLLGDVAAYSFATRSVWLILPVLALLALGALTGGTATLVPYAVYTLL